MPTTSDAPYSLFAAVDQVPLSGSLSGSSPYWMYPALYITVGQTAGDLETLSASAEYSISQAGEEEFEWGGSNYKFNTKKGFEIDPVGGISGKFRHAGRGLSKWEVQGADFRNPSGELKAKSGNYLIKGASGKIWWSSYVNDWDYAKQKELVNEGEQMFGNPRSTHQEFSNVVTRTSGSQVVAPPAPSG